MMSLVPQIPHLRAVLELVRLSYQQFNEDQGSPAYVLR